MNKTVNVAETLEMIELALLLGDQAYALELAGEIIDHADPDTLGLLTEISETCQEYPKIAPTKLGETWKRSTEEHRAIIETCVDIHKKRPHPTSTDNEPATTPEVLLRADVHTPTLREAAELWTGRPTDTSRCDRVRHRHSPEAYREPRGPMTKAEKQAEKIFTNYRRYRAGVDDEAVRETPIAYELDYDDAAIPPLRGLACIQCFTERTPKENDLRDDDGLCTECYSLKRPALPILPLTAFRDEAIANRCAFIAANYPRTTAHALFRRDWYAYPAKDRVDQVHWVVTWRAGHDHRTTHYEDLSTAA